MRNNFKSTFILGEYSFFTIVFYFLLFFQEISIGFVQFFNCRFLINLYVLQGLEHDWRNFENVSRECLPVCDKNFMSVLSQVLMHENSQRIKFGYTMV